AGECFLRVRTQVRVVVIEEDHLLENRPRAGGRCLRGTTLLLGAADRVLARLLGSTPGTLTGGIRQRRRDRLLWRLVTCARRRSRDEHREQHGTSKHPHSSLW